MEYALLQRYMQHSVSLKLNISGPLSLMTADPHIHFRDLTALTASTILCLFLAWYNNIYIASGCNKGVQRTTDFLNQVDVKSFWTYMFNVSIFVKTLPFNFAFIVCFKYVTMRSTCMRFFLIELFVELLILTIELAGMLLICEQAVPRAEQVSLVRKHSSTTKWPLLGHDRSSSSIQKICALCVWPQLQGTCHLLLNRKFYSKGAKSLANLGIVLHRYKLSQIFLIGLQPCLFGRPVVMYISTDILSVLYRLLSNGAVTWHC